MKPYLLFALFIALIAYSSCNQAPSQKTTSEETNKKYKYLDSLRARLTPIEKDWEEIIKDGKLKVLTTYSGTSYFLYKGRTMGFEFELLKKFADDMKLEIDLHIIKDIDSMFIYLNRGDGDLVAHTIAQTRKRNDLVSFTKPLFSSHQVLVQKMPEKWYALHWKVIEDSLLHDPIELIGKKVSVRANSSYHDRLLNLSDEMGGKIIIDEVPGEMTTEEIIELVAEGKLKYTVADNNIASLLASYYPILNTEIKISTTQNMAWATRKNSPVLLSKINEWLIKYKKETDYYVTYNKYYKNKKDFRKRVNSDFYSLKNNQISKYDDLVKKEAEQLNWDWRLLMSQVYQESRFDPHAVSWAGASGLMQIMPLTAKELGVKNRNDPKQSLNGGVRYLKYLMGQFEDVPDTLQRIKLALASYNCGYGHVADAQRLALKKHLDPYKWDENVEEMILALRYPKNYNDESVKHGYTSGLEPYTYVRQIFERYEHYKVFIRE